MDFISPEKCAKFYVNVELQRVICEILAQDLKDCKKRRQKIRNFPMREGSVADEETRRERWERVGNFGSLRMMYIFVEQLNYQKIFIMQKAAVSTENKGEGLNYFKYEMKETNQLLKNFITCSISDSLTRQADNKEQIFLDDMFRESISIRKIQNPIPLDYLKKLSDRKNHLDPFLLKQSLKYVPNSEDQLQNDQNLIFQDLIKQNLLTPKRKKNPNNSIETLILQRFYLEPSENEDEDTPKPPNQKQKYRDSESYDPEKLDDTKQNKKQKKGLANISLRVKNIVSEHKKLTYKQVSDYVLQYSKDEIDQLEPNQRIKEAKNIKRRVYDALNVLVAVGILGKHQRCVCITEWTNVPGKRHSTEWQKINSKIEYLNKLKKNCSDKSQALKLLIDKYNAITALRNKHLEEESLVKTKTEQKIKVEPHQQKNKITLESQSENENLSLDKKLMFPVIVFCPAFNEDPTDKLMVEFEEAQEPYEESESDDERAKKKVKISGKNIAILGDFDCALQMDLEKYRNADQETKLIEEIQQYANQCARKRLSSTRLETDDFGDGSIEHYFNQQMFQMK